MSSSRAPRSGRHAPTFRRRLVQLYVALFMLTQFVCVGILYLAQRQSMHLQTRRSNAIFANEFTFEYMTGVEFTHDKRQRPLSQAPASFMAAVRQRRPNFEPRLFYTTEDGERSVLGVVGSEVTEFSARIDTPENLRMRSFEVADRVAWMHAEFNEESYGEDAEHLMFLLMAPDGAILAKSSFRKTNPEIFARVAHAGDGLHDTVLRLPDTRIMAHYRRLYDGNHLVIAQDMRILGRYMTNLLYSSLAMLLLSFAISVYAGRWLASKFVSSIKRVAQAARVIGAGRYTQRVAYGDEGAEMNDLIDAFNEMTSKTEKLLDDLKAISESLAHDLRTPLTRMRAQAELAVQDSHGESSLASDVAEECAGMLTMINNMMHIARLERATQDAPHAELDITAETREILELFAAVADDKEIHFETRLPDHPIKTPFDKVNLQRMLANLLDNAIKFTDQGGAVTVTLTAGADGISFTVSDTGCGIPPDAVGRIFERFYRADASRNIPGNGLGLSLTKAIVDACRGDIQVSSREGGGTTFEVTLPLIGGRDGGSVGSDGGSARRDGDRPNGDSGGDGVVGIAGTSTTNAVNRG